MRARLPVFACFYKQANALRVLALRETIDEWSFEQQAWLAKQVMVDQALVYAISP
jgi:hypothetical protein